MFNYCHNAAKHAWCSMNFYNNAIPASMYINLLEKQNLVFYDTDCLMKIATENV